MDIDQAGQLVQTYGVRHRYIQVLLRVARVQHGAKGAQDKTGYDRTDEADRPQVTRGKLINPLITRAGCRCTRAWHSARIGDLINQLIVTLSAAGSHCSASSSALTTWNHELSESSVSTQLISPPKPSIHDPSLEPVLARLSKNYVTVCRPDNRLIP